MSLDIFGALPGLFVIVYDGQHALRFTLGRAQAVVGPGIHFKVPLLQVFKVEETKHTTLDLEPQVIQLDDNLIYEVDCKVLYQVVNLRKAIIEVDDLVTGLQNRVVMAVQRVISKRNRHTVTDVDGMCKQIQTELRGVEDEWGVRILELGFSNISPSPTTLEITQLEMLAREKQTLFGKLREDGLSEESAVALIAGAVISVHPDERMPSNKVGGPGEDLLVQHLESELQEDAADRARREAERLLHGESDKDPMPEEGEDQ